MKFDWLRSHKLGSMRLVQCVVRSAYPRASVRTVLRGPLKGTRFKVAPAMGFTYAWGIGIDQWSFAGLAEPGMCIYDIGANCGQSTLALAKSVGVSGRVIAFEPVQQNFARLLTNIELNPHFRITAVNAAAAENDGWLDFQFDADLPTQGHLKDVEPTYILPNADIFRVRAIRLDNYAMCNWPVPHLLKIDVEGGAKGVLGGARELIARNRPAIYIELHGPEEQQAIRSLARDFDYTIRALNGEPVSDPVTDSFSTLICKPREQSA